MTLREQWLGTGGRGSDLLDYVLWLERRIEELENGLRNIYEMLPTKRENDQDIIDEIKRLLKPKENEG